MFYPNLGLPLALELVNTQFAAGGQPRDALQTPADLTAWLAANAEQLHGIEIKNHNDANIDRFRQLRAALRQLFSAVANGARPPSSDLQVLNDLCAAAPRIDQLIWADGAPPQLRILELADPTTAVLAQVARSAIHLLTTGAGVAQCQAPGCVLFFTRDAHRRQWCSPACGNRARVARHYVRHRHQN